MAATSIAQSTAQTTSNDGANTSVMGRASVISAGTSGGEPSASAASSERLHNRKFGFEAKASFDARLEFVQKHARNFRYRKPPVDDDIWRRPPPDFRPQCFEGKPPKRNSQEAMQPWRYGPLPAEVKPTMEAGVSKATARMQLPELMRPQKAKEAEDFELMFHVPDNVEGRIEFVMKGMVKPGQYEDLHPHDYRQYPTMKSLGQPEFQTIFEADPYNIKFHSERLRIIHGLSRGVPPERNIKGQQMAPPLHQPPKWEARLHLPRGPWPTPVAQYSRFRPFWRSPQTVLLDRIENSLASKWAMEKGVRSNKPTQFVRSNHV